jgi:hypothetical protein
MENKLSFTQELENAWNFVHLLVEIAAPALFLTWSLEKTGLFRSALIVASVIMAANALVQLYSLIRK